MVPVVATACLLPPELETEVDPSFPPQVDPSTLRPREPLLRLRLTCPSFNVEVNDIIDLDSRDLRVRWVVNNNLDGTRLLEEDVLPPLDPGTVQRDSWRLDINEDLDIDRAGDGPDVNDTPILSFFVTDAPQWAGGLADGGLVDRTDLGRIGGEGTVVEIRWTFTFGEGGECL